VIWEAITGLSTGGASIDSYNIKFDSGTGSWTDVTGGDGDFQLALEYLLTTGITGGVSYQFTVRAHNAHGWGQESDILIVVAAESPQQMDPPTTFINNIFVKVEWLPAVSNGSPITEYKVFVKNRIGQFLQENTYCNGAVEPVLSQHFCEIPMSVLVQPPYALEFDDEVVAYLTASNQFGQNDASLPSTTNARI
jgi:hypothetical protein